MQFSAIPGLGATKEVLVNAIATGHIAHAQLFAGQMGNAQLALALAYVTYLYCENRQPEDSCGTCPSCAKMARLVHPDLGFVFPNATNKRVTKEPNSEAFLPEFREFVLGNPFGTLQEWGAGLGTENKQLIISVADARIVQRNMALKPYEAQYKCVIMWLPEMMRTEAANALLKLLEEPQPNTLFLLVSADPNRVLTTIISRCQNVFLEPYSREEIAAYLQDRLHLDAVASQRVALLADGVLREAELLVNDTEDSFFPLFSSWMRSAFGRKYADILTLAEQFSTMGREAQKNLIAYSSRMIREALVYHVSGGELVRLPQEEMEFIERFSPFVHEQNMAQLSHLMEQAAYHIERNASAKLVFTDTSFQLSTALSKKTA